MSVADNYSPVVVAGTASTISFLWVIPTTSWLVVESKLLSTGAKTTLVEGTDYMVVLSESGGIITIVSPLGALYNYIASMKVPITQETPYSTSKGFQGKVIENSFDKITRVAQELSDDVDRSLKFAVGVSGIDAEIPTLEANKMLLVNTSGDGFVLSEADFTDIETNLNTVASNTTNINTVASNISSVNTVASDTTNVNTVASNIASVNSVAGSVTNVNSVAADLTNINNVAADLTNIDTVATNVADVNSAAEAVSAACKYKFSTTTTMDDPTTGYLRFNNATLASVTAIAIDDQTAQTGNPNIAAYIATWDDSTGSVKGKLRISKGTSPATFAIYSITGLTTNSGWTQLAVTYTDGAGTLSNDDDIFISFCPNGNDGTSFSKTDITGQTAATIASGDSIVFSDASDSGNLKKVDLLGTAHTYAGAQRQINVTLTDGATITPDFALGNNFNVVLGGNRTLGIPSNIVAAQSFNIDFIQDATGSRTLAYAWGYHFSGGTAPVLSTAGCSTDTLYGDVKVYKQSAVTISIATPAVVSYTAHGLVTGQRVQITTTGTLPTGLTASTSYYVIVNDADSFWLATSLANAAAGTKIATSGSQSGVHTLTACRINASLGIKGAA